MHNKFNPIPNDVAYIDSFKDSHLDTGFWISAVTGGVTLAEGIGILTIIHDAAAVVGTGSITTLKRFGWHQTISTGLTLTTGSVAGDGNHAEAGITLYKDATHFVKFGPYRDTAAGTNRLSMLHYQNGGADNYIAFSSTICDALLHQYTIVMLENRAILILDGSIVYDFELTGFMDYTIKLDATVTAVGDHLHATFSNFMCVKNTDFLASIFQSGSSAAILAQLIATDIIVDDIHADVLDLHGDVSNLDGDLVAAKAVIDDIHADLITADGITDDIKAQVLLMDTKHTFSGHIDLPNTNVVELTFDSATHGDQFELVLAAALGMGVMEKAVVSDNGSYTDFTSQCNSLATRDVRMLPAVPVTNQDAFIVMAAAKFCYIDIYMEGGVANTNNVIAIQYYKDDHTWVAIPGVTDGTFSTQSLGKSGRVSFSPPADWDTQTIDGFVGYAVRFLVTTAGADVPYATHIQLSADTSESFDQVAGVFDTLLVYIKRNFPTIGYQYMIGDKMEYVQAIGIRDVDINGYRCYGDTKIGFQLGATPGKNVAIPYFGFTRRL
jgi:hypothetical protein